MPEEIEKVLELAKPPAAKPPGPLAVSKSARFCRVCARLVLGSAIVFWLVLGLVSLVEGIPIMEVATRNIGDWSELFVAIVFLAGIYLMPWLVLGAAIAGVVGFISAKRFPGNRRIFTRALVLTALAVIGFVVPLLYILARSIRFF